MSQLKQRLNGKDLWLMLYHKLLIINTLHLREHFNEYDQQHINPLPA